jgi:hypothetical protein
MNCPCGLPLHYKHPLIEKLISGIVADKGEFMPVETPYGTWLVSRHFIALHGLDTETLPSVAERYGFKKR